MNALLWLTVVLLPVIVTSYDPSLSNGTCYYGAKQKADSGFIPCGNAVDGVQSCCQARDICLSSNACFNGQYYVTYLAGCTDENYADGKCPDKGQYADQQWVGLVRCKVSSGANEEWAGCSEPVQPKINDGNKNCVCNASRKTALFTDAATLTNIASLPVSAGNAIAWYSGFTPSTTVTDFSSTSAATVTNTNGGSQTATSTTLPSSPSPSDTALAASNPLSVSAKAGIGVGTAAGVVAIGALLFWFVLHRRKRNKNIPPIQNQIRPSSISPWNPDTTETSTGLGLVGNHHKSWGGRSELPTEANDVTTTKTNLGDGTITTSIHTPATIYQPYQHSPTTAVSEADGSPAASTSRLTAGASASKPSYEKPIYGGPIYEMPG